MILPALAARCARGGESATPANLADQDDDRHDGLDDGRDGAGMDSGHHRTCPRDRGAHQVLEEVSVYPRLWTRCGTDISTKRKSAWGLASGRPPTSLA